MLPADGAAGAGLPDRRRRADLRLEPAQHAVGAVAAGRRQRVQHLRAQALLRPDPATTCSTRPRSTAPAGCGCCGRSCCRCRGRSSASSRSSRSSAIWKDFLWPLLVLPDPETQTLSVGSDAGSPAPASAAERAHRRPGDRQRPDDRRLPGLPAQHHRRPLRRQPEGLTDRLRTAISVDRRTVVATRVDDQKAGDRGHLRPAPWWRAAAIYQVYPRSFADGNGDGIGDLAGVRGPPALPARPRRRRDLVQPLVPVADGRRRLRRRRLPRHRPGLRHAGRGRGAHRRGARAGHPHHRRHRARTTAPTSTRGSRRRWRRPGLAGAGPVLVPRRPGATATTAAQRLARRSSAARPGPGVPDGAVVPAPVRPRAARLQLGPPRGARGVRGHPAVLVRPRASTASGSTRPRCCVKDPALPEVARTGTPHPFHRPRRACTTSTAPGGGSPTRTRDRALIGEVWLPDVGALRQLPAPGRAAHRVQLRLPRLPVGRRRLLRECIDAHAARARAGRRPGHLGAVQPRRDPARHPVRPRGHLVQLRRPTLDGTPADLALGTRRARAAALLSLVAARLGLRLPGRGAGPVGGRGHPADADRQDPMCAPLRRRRPGPRRLPGAAAVVRRRAAVRLQPGRRDRHAVAAAAGRSGRTAPSRRRPATRTRCSSSTARRCACAAASRACDGPR